MPPSQFDISWEDFRSIPVVMPPLATQRAIADYLDRETARIDALIAAKQRMVELLETKRTVILLRAVAPHLLVSERVPNSWSRTRLKYLFQPPVTGAWGNEETGGLDDILCVRVADFDRARFRVTERANTLRSVEKEVRARCRLANGDILIEKSGGGEAQPVGFAVVFDLLQEAICSNFVARLRPAPGVVPAYGGLVLAAAYRAAANVPFVKQTTGIQNLDLPGYLSIPWHIPTEAEQQAICLRLRDAFAKIDEVRDDVDRQLTLLQERRQAAITTAVTGQLDISEVA